MTAINRLKDIQEKLGAKKQEIRTYLDKAAMDKRSIAADDATLKTLEVECDNLSATFQAEARQAARESEAVVPLTKGEQKTVDAFHLGKALRATLRGQPLTGAEAEIVAEGFKEARESQLPGADSGLMLPSFFCRRGPPKERRAGNAMSATGTTSVTGDQGGMTIALDKKGLLDDFYAASVLESAGATVLNDLVGKIDIPRLLQATAAAKKTENANADAANPTTSMLSLLPKRLPAYVDIGEQLLIQSSSAIETVVRRNLVAQMISTRETAFFHGTGTSEATGIAATAGIGSVAGGTNGLAPAWTHIVQLEGKVDYLNAIHGTPQYFINAKTKAQLKQTLRSAGDTASNYIINDNAGGIMNGYEWDYTNAIASNLVKGASGAVCSALFFGIPDDYWVGYWGGMHLELLRDSTNAIAGQYRLAAACYYDGGVARVQSFSAMLDALTALA